MKEIKNLIYTLEINYKNNSGLNTSIYVKMHDNGLELKSFKVGNVCITEETINGRILSGRYDKANKHCGYRYDYENGENLLNINPHTPLDTAISLINKTKMESDFLAAKLVLSSVSRNDYKIISLNNGNLNVIRTVSAENEKLKNYSLQEIINLYKFNGKDKFIEQNNQRLYKIDKTCVTEEANPLDDNDIKLNILSEILCKNPQNYKDLIELKIQIQKNLVSNLNEEKTL